MRLSLKNWLIFPLIYKKVYGPTDPNTIQGLTPNLFYTAKAKNTSGSSKAPKIHSAQLKNKKQVSVSSLVHRGRHSPS